MADAADTPGAADGVLRPTPLWAAADGVVRLGGLSCRTLAHNLPLDDPAMVPDLAVVLFHGFGASNDQFEGLMRIVLKLHPSLEGAKVCYCLGACVQICVLVLGNQRE